MGIYLAQEKGFFKDQGIDVEVTDIENSGAPMTVLLANGQLDVAGGNLTSGLFKAIAQEKGAKLVADKGHIGKDTDYIVLLVRKDHLDSGRFKTLKDLRGFKMGLTALDGVSQQILTDKFLQKGGLGEKDIEFVKLSYAEMNTALKTKSIDATVQLEPFVAQAEQAGFARVVAKGSEVYPGQQSAALIYSKKFLANRDQAIRFMMAYLKGVRLYNRSLKDSDARRDVAGILQKRLGIQDTIGAKMAPVGLNSDGNLNLLTLDGDLHWYQEKGFLKSDTPTSSLVAKDVVDLSFAREAVRRLDGK